MKKLLYLVFASVLLVSCQITERAYIEENGSVRYETELNFSEMIGMVYNDATKDSLRQIGQFPIDSVMNFSDLEKMEPQSDQKEMSAGERDFMKVLDKMKVHMLVNDNEGKVTFGIQEKDINSFNAYMKQIQAASEKLAKEDPDAAENFSKSGLMNPMEFQYNGKSFQRIASNQTAGIFDDMNDSTANSMKQMMGMFQYKMEYHFPKKIKNSSIENATYSLDGKTMTIDVSMTELIENPEKYNFKIEFE